MVITLQIQLRRTECNNQKGEISQTPIKFGVLRFEVGVKGEIEKKNGTGKRRLESIAVNGAGEMHDGVGGGVAVAPPLMFGSGGGSGGPQRKPFLKIEATLTRCIERKPF
ncbi:hypothetical protein F2Q69_00038943 [Brassica cretica]|uniref:Uncharacterized protein n=1 Tax=Brassica cretica TaxID=69181 RepID=A0A8S9SQB6_BRACR|nr:hypothetical protein F2Q69_00038943 [Brassica cretica]